MVAFSTGYTAKSMKVPLILRFAAAAAYLCITELDESGRD